MIKILHVISSLNDGGAEGVMTRLATNKDKEFKHFVIALKEGGKYSSILESSNVDVKVFSISNIASAIIHLPRLAIYIYKISPDIVQTWMYHADVIGGILAKILGIKSVIWNVRSGEFHPGQKLSTKIFIKLSSLLSGSIPSKVVSCSKRAIQIHKEIGYSHKFHLIDNGVDKSVFMQNDRKRSAFRDEFKIDKSCVLFGTVARFDPQKDHKKLLKAVSLINNRRDFKLVLVGRGMDRGNIDLMGWIKKYRLGDIVILAGQRKDIDVVMCGLDFLILPSLYGEAFPNVVIEAMSVGTPAIVTDVGDSERIVNDLGWVVSPYSSKELCTTIKSAADLVASNYPQYKEMSIACIENIDRNYTLNVMNNKYHTLWKNVLNRR